jgi:hypothetical protein
VTKDPDQSRDSVHRAYLHGKDWDDNDECKLKSSPALARAALLTACPLLVEDELDVVPGKTNEGLGDLVFTDGEGTWAVVDVKLFEKNRPGSTVRRNRRTLRRKVREQATASARLIYHRRYPDQLSTRSSSRTTAPRGRDTWKLSPRGSRARRKH